MKKKFILAAILAAAITLTGCGTPSESGAGDDDKNPSISDTDKSNNDSDKSDSDNSDSDSKSDSDSNSDSDSKSDAEPSGDVAYEPVSIKVDDIRTEGDVKYFDMISEYGNAFSAVFRYNYKNDKMDSAAVIIKPGTVTDLKTIVDKLSAEGEAVDFSQFTKTDEGWMMTQNISEMEGAEMTSALDIDTLYAIMKMAEGAAQGGMPDEK